MINNICNELFDSIRDWYAKEEFDPDGQLIYRILPLAGIWLDKSGRWEQKDQLGKQQHCQEKRIR